MDDHCPIRTRQVASNETRIPEPQAGEAIIVCKYGDGRKAVILHPEDFDLLERYRRILGRVPYEMRLTETAIAAHQDGEAGADTAGLDVESLERALS